MASSKRKSKAKSDKNQEGDGTTMTEEKGTSTEIEVVETGIQSPTLADLASGNPHPAFASNYGERLKRVVKPTQGAILQIVKGLPGDIRDKVIDLVKKMNPDRPGLYLSNERPTFTELRLFQGSGNDPNRPENAAVGQFYLTSKTNVGKKFVGTVIALYQGRTMWPGPDEGARTPVCNSMDRKFGSKYGECTTCPNRPWKDGERTNCGNDVVAFMLPKDLSDIVMIRFQRTSVSAGEQLATFIKKDLVLWQRWFEISSEKRTSNNDSSIRWYVMKVDPVEEEEVPYELTEFIGCLCSMAEHDFIIPGISAIYRQAADSMAGVEAETKTASGDTKSDDKNSKYEEGFNV